MQSSKIKEQDAEAFDPKKLDTELQRLMHDRVLRPFEEYIERKKNESAQEALVAAALKKGQSKTKKEINKADNETPGLEEQDNFTSANK